MKNEMKQTEIGLIPKEWEVGPMEDYCDVIDPHPSHRAPQEDPNGFPFIGIGDIDEQGKINIEKARKVSLDDVLQQRQIFELKEGDIGFGRVASIGKVVWFKKQFYPYAISPTMALIRPKKVLSTYAYHFLSSELTSSQFRMISAGSTRISIGMKNLRQLYFALPPLPEQQKIAEILSTLDEKMAVIDEQLAQTQELKKGLMQRLLTRGIGHTEFKDSPLGPIPVGWEVMRMKDVCSKVTDGTHFSPKPTKEGIPFITAIHVKEGYIDFANCKFLPQDVHDEIYRRCNPEKGDVLIVNIGAGTANPALIKVDFEFSLKNVALLKPKKGLLCGDFLEAYQIFKRQSIVDTLITGGAQPFLSLKALGELTILLPPLPEQRQIAEILTTVDDKIGVLEAKKAQYQTLKRGLMQQLLTGQRRVRVAPAEAVLAEAP